MPGDDEHASCEREIARLAAELAAARAAIHETIHGPTGQKATMRLLDQIKPRLDGLLAELLDLRAERDRLRQALEAAQEALAYAAECVGAQTFDLSVKKLGKGRRAQLVNIVNGMLAAAEGAEYRPRYGKASVEQTRERFAGVLGSTEGDASAS
jgi:hypothetical protein